MSGGFGRILVVLDKPTAEIGDLLRSISECVRLYGFVPCRWVDNGWGPNKPFRQGPLRRLASIDELVADFGKLRQIEWPTANFCANLRSKIEFDFKVIFKRTNDFVYEITFELFFDLGLRRFTERQQNFVCRLGLSALSAARRIRAREIEFIDIYGDSILCSLSPDQAGNERTIFTGTIKLCDCPTCKLWLTEQGATFPVESFDEQYLVWGGGKRGKGDPAVLNTCLFSGLRASDDDSFDWQANVDRIEVFRVLATCSTIEDIANAMGSPQYLLGPIFHTEEDYLAYDTISVSEQMVYTSALNDAMVIVRVWEDGICTALGAGWI